MTDEQPNPFEVASRKIDDVLRELVEATPDEDGAATFLTDWYVVAAAHVDDGGEFGGSSYRRLVRVNQPPHASLGLLEHERIRLAAFLNSHDEDG